MEAERESYRESEEHQHNNNNSSSSARKSKHPTSIYEYLMWAFTMINCLSFAHGHFARNRHQWQQTSKKKIESTTQKSMALLFQDTKHIIKRSCVHMTRVSIPSLFLSQQMTNFESLKIFVIFAENTQQISSVPNGTENLHYHYV